MAWLAQSERAFAVFMLQAGIVCCYPLQTLAKGAQDRTFRFGISNFPERNHHLTHPRVTARGGGGGQCMLSATARASHRTCPPQADGRSCYDATFANVFPPGTCPAGMPDVCGCASHAVWDALEPVLQPPPASGPPTHVLWPGTSRRQPVW